MRLIELKPCPFCGREMFLEQRKKDKMYYLNGWHKWNCIMNYTKLPSYNIPEVAAKEWNRRVSDEKAN